MMQKLCLFAILKNIEKTLITRTQGTKIESDGLRGYMFEESFADVQNDRVAFRKFKLITEDGQGKSKTKQRTKKQSKAKKPLINFHGMDLTQDKMCSMVNKWQTRP